MRDAKRKSATVAKQPVQSFLTTAFYRRLHEGFLIVLTALGVFFLLSLATYHRIDPSFSHQIDQTRILNSGGRVGAWLSDFLLYIFGYAAYLIPFVLFYGVYTLYRHKPSDENKIKVNWWLGSMQFFALILAISSATALLNLYLPAKMNLLPYQAGGIIGEVVGDNVLHWFNQFGATVFLTPILLISISSLTGTSWLQLIDLLGAKLLLGCAFIKNYFSSNIFASFRLPKILPKLFEKKPPLLNSIRAFREPTIGEADPLFDNTEDLISAPKSSVVSSVTSSVTSKALITTPKITSEEPTVLSSVPRYSKSTVLPKLSLLDEPTGEKKVGLSRELLEQRSREVEQRLHDFGVDVKVAAVHPGPVVTRFELSLAAGTKVSKISSLVKDLARSFSVTSVRVVEVIPGKSVIGLELPNPNREVVTLKEVLSTKAFSQSPSALTIALGKDIAGESVVVDLAKMPHLLVAGTTGSGKSVALNAMLLSLLYKSSPQDLRLILIDPKMLELSVYDNIPHLLAPVVTDMKDAAGALRWCVVEMERRYRLMSTLGVRNIAGYNQKVKEAINAGAPLLDPLSPPDGDTPRELQILPKIVVLADEFADMMVVVGKKVETLIARLAQKARAAGIHLIFATQRPSVDVITGLIKANIPTRIAFQVSSKIDSRTIIDQQGAEQLLGHGDMLYLPPGSGVPVRVHGCLVSDEEVHRVVKDLKLAGKPDYLVDILNDSVGVDPTGYTEHVIGEDPEDGERDPLYDEAVQFIAKAQRVSVSSIQRRFKIGYNRAARMVEAMEIAGIVSKMEGNSQRDVLVPLPAE